MRRKPPQIIAMGGGGFSVEPENPALERYVLAQAGVARPAVCFLATASGDAAAYIAKFYAAFSRFECRPSHLALFERTPDVRSMLLRQQVIYVGGGNTKSMLAVWREWGIDRVLREAWRAGIVLAGISAGAICWFEQGLTDSFAGKLAVLDCLGFLPGSSCPHYDGESARRPVYHDLLLKKRIAPGLALDDGAAIHFIQRRPHRVVSSRPTARAYRMRIVKGAVSEQPFPVEYLGSRTVLRSLLRDGR